MIDTHADDRQKLHGARERQRGSTENALDTARLGKARLRARLRARLAAAFSLTRHARQEAQTNENSDVPPLAGNLPVGSPGPE